MKPEFNSRRLFGITRSKGKMYELGLQETLHIAVPEKSEPQELFLLTVSTLGDVAATISEAEKINGSLPQETIDDLTFSASFFDAFLGSKFSVNISRDTTLLAASAYYLVRRPGSSLVLARQLGIRDEDPPVDKLLRWVLIARWAKFQTPEHPLFGKALSNVARLLALHFHDGSSITELNSALKELRQRAYRGASPRDLLFIDIISAVIRMRLEASAWTTLPRFSGISKDQWARAIRRPDFPKELWPSQMLIGQAGLFSGASGVVQMPTSAGKTRSIEIVLRSGFLSGRTRLAVVVAPFRALCHEISTSLRHAFRAENVKVNELSDAMQLDFLDQVEELSEPQPEVSQYILVLTPEKLLYVLRQTPSIVNEIGIVIYDEGHQFDTGGRGITYELLLTEIKALLPAHAQTVLVSAVIQNPKAVGEWLIGDTVQVVSGSGLLPTTRSVAFASWERLGQLLFFESQSYKKPDYFVPRVIEQQKLEKRGRESIDRFFPKKESNDIALYLGIRLVRQGAVAIFCGRKATASNMAARAVEVFDRGFALRAPAEFADQDELRRMKNLMGAHFGDKSVISLAASLGIFVHHGTTPHGIRLSIEHAMQKGCLNFVACTSTLAQGVNLPIRYLILSGVRQGGEKISARDFQNLIGRAGRSGMHTEGLIIFSDPEIYDKRQADSWGFDQSVNLISEKSERATSSLLGLLDPLTSSDGRWVLSLTVDELCALILSDESEWPAWAKKVEKANHQRNFEANALVAELKKRRRLLTVVESYLMANRGVSSAQDFKASAEKLATATLGYYLASDEQKRALKTLFSFVADYVQQQEPSPEKQKIYSKTLLGVKSAKAIERWVTENRKELLLIHSNEAWLNKVWDLFSELSFDKFFHDVLPESLPFQLALLWLQGHPYKTFFDHSNAEHGTKPWGKKRARLTEDDIVDFFERTLGFECALILAAVVQFLYGEAGTHDEGAAALTLFQKALKYGLPDAQSISCYEDGFVDRVVAQHLCHAVRAEGYLDNFFEPALEMHRDTMETVLKNYPSYFESVLTSRS